METTLAAPPSAFTGFRTWISVARPHILGIVFASTLVYGWIMSGRFDATVAGLAVWDWFIVNFLNRATDTEEDEANGIAGVLLVSRSVRGMQALGAAMIVAGLAVGALVRPELMAWRGVFTAIGLAYNYRLIPVPGHGWTRLKETYFFKNFGSAMLFTLSVFIYPYFGIAGADQYAVTKLLLAIAFFIPLELSYEIFYDLRDVHGDRRTGVPTYPVVHGEAAAKRIILGLLAVSALPMIAGALTGVLRLHEWCVVAAVIQQLWVYRLIARGDRLPTSGECIAITWLGAAQLLSYAAWVGMGLPLGR